MTETARKGRRAGNGAAPKGAARGVPATATGFLAELPDLYVFLDRCDRITMMTGAVEHWHVAVGSTPDRAIGTRPWEILPAGAGARVRQAAALARTTGRPVTTSFCYGTLGGERHDEARLLPTGGGGLLIIVRDVTRQNSAEEQVRESERTLRTLLGNLPGMAYRCHNDPEWTFEFASEGCRDLTGYVASDLVGNAKAAYGDLIHRDDRQKVWDDIQAALNGGAPWTITYRITTADGLEKWVWERGVGVFDDAGSLIALEGLITDVTALHEAERALAERERMLSTLLANLPGAAYRARTEPPCLDEYVSDGSVELTGYPPERIVAGDPTWRDMMPEEDRERVTADLEAAIAAGKTRVDFEYRLVTATGEEKWVWERSTLLRDDTGSANLLEGIIIDVSARRGAENALRERERQLSSLMTNIPGVVYRSPVTPPFTNQFLGDGCEELTGYAKDALLAGRPAWEEIVCPDDRQALRDETERAIAEHRAGEGEYRITTADGGRKWVWDRFVVTRDGDGRPVGREGLLIDVTDRHQAERALRASERQLTLRNRIAGIFLTSDGGDTFGKVLDLVRAETGSRWALFGYLGDDGALVVPSMSADVWGADHGHEERRFPCESWSDNLWSRALRSATTQRLDTPGQVPAGHLAIDTALAVPVTMSDEAIGLIVVANRGWPYDAGDQSLLEGLADYIAPVLHEWRLTQFEERARREAESALRSTEARYRALFEQSPIGVLMYDRELRFTDINDRWLDMVGCSRETQLATASQIKDTRILPALRAPVQGKTGQYEGSYRSTTGGKDLYIRLSTTPLLSGEGEIAGGIAVMADLTDQHRAEAQMEHLKLHDPVTGLPNRALLLDRGKQAIAQARRRRQTFAVAAVEIDRFAQLAHTLGHDAVDDLLRQVATRLTATVREEDTVARVGGYEFALLLPGAAGPAKTGIIVGNLTGAFATPFTVAGHELYVTVSVGVAVFPADGATGDELFHNAETAVHRASADGTGRWQFFHASMNAEREDRLALEGELHRALERGQFTLHYQPQVEAATGAVLGVEALLRWRHPERGLVPPLSFLPVVEDLGLMSEVGAWVLRTAALQAASWNAELDHPVRIAVNLSASQLVDDAVVGLVAQTLADSGLASSLLELEITETAALRDPERTASLLARFADMGVRIALDDFGTGYSIAQPPHPPADHHREDRPLVRARPALGARACRRGHLGHSAGPSPGPVRGRRRRRDTRGVRVSARRGMRRDPGLPAEPAAAGGHVRTPAARRSIAGLAVASA